MLTEGGLIPPFKNEWQVPGHLDWQNIQIK